MAEQSDNVVVLTGAEARLAVHALDTFERLLRYGNLTDAQLDLLTADGTGRPEAAADLLMADVVAEASTPIRAQLGG